MIFSAEISSEFKGNESRLGNDLYVCWLGKTPEEFTAKLIRACPPHLAAGYPKPQA